MATKCEHKNQLNDWSASVSLANERKARVKMFRVHSTLNATNTFRRALHAFASETLALQSKTCKLKTITSRQTANVAGHALM